MIPFWNLEGDILDAEKYKTKAEVYLRKRAIKGRRYNYIGSIDLYISVYSFLKDI